MIYKKTSKIAVLCVVLIVFAGIFYFNEKTQRNNKHDEEKDVCIYDAIEIIINGTFHSWSGAPSDYRVPYYNDEKGAIAGGVSRYLDAGWNGMSFICPIDRYDYGAGSVIDEDGNPSTTGGHGLDSLKYDYIRAWARIPRVSVPFDRTNVTLTLTVTRRQVYEKEGSRYENVTILGSDSIFGSQGEVRVECYPEHIELPDTLKNGRLAAETLWNDDIKACLVIWHENSKELMITFRREYTALGGMILNRHSGGIPKELTDFSGLLESPENAARSYINPTLTDLGWSPCGPDEYDEENVVILFIGVDQEVIEKMDFDRYNSYLETYYYPTLRKLSILSFDCETIW